MKAPSWRRMCWFVPLTGSIAQQSSPQIPVVAWFAERTIYHVTTSKTLGRFRGGKLRADEVCGNLTNPTLRQCGERRDNTVDSRIRELVQTLGSRPTFSWPVVSTSGYLSARPSTDALVVFPNVEQHRASLAHRHRSNWKEEGLAGL